MSAKLPLNLTRYRGKAFERLHSSGAPALTASNVPCLYGVGRASRYELHLHQSGQRPLEAGNGKLLDRGLALQDVVAGMVADERGVEVKPLRAYARHATLPLIASPDALVLSPEREDPGIAEIKVVASPVFKADWQGEDGADDRPPLHVQLQHQAQYACTGARWGIIAALVIGVWEFDLRVYETEPHEGAIRRLEGDVERFMADVAAGRLPDVDEADRSSVAAMREIYRISRPEAEIELDDAEMAERQAARWLEAREVEKNAKAEKERAAAWFQKQMGTNERARFGNMVAVWKSHMVAEHIVKAGPRRPFTIKELTNG